MACVDAKRQPAPASACLGLTAPAAVRACNTAPCVGHTWQVGRSPVRFKFSGTCSLCSAFWWRAPSIKYSARGHHRRWRHSHHWEGEGFLSGFQQDLKILFPSLIHMGALLAEVPVYGLVGLLSESAAWGSSNSDGSL